MGRQIRRTDCTERKTFMAELEVSKSTLSNVVATSHMCLFPFKFK